MASEVQLGHVMIGGGRLVAVPSSSRGFGTRRFRFNVTVDMSMCSLMQMQGIIMHAQGAERKHRYIRSGS
jgi:hypothetical protein